MFGLFTLWNGCGALRVGIPKEAQVFRDKIISDALSYSYSALEFGASNETQFKTWSLVKNLAGHGGVHGNKSQYEYGVEDNRWLTASRKPKQQQQQQQQHRPHPWPNHSVNHRPTTTKKASPAPSSSPFKPSPVAVSPFPHFSIRPSIDPTRVSDIYPKFRGFHPLLFATSPSPGFHTAAAGGHHGTVFNHFEFRSSTPTPFTNDHTSRIVLSSGISVSGGNVANENKKENFKQGGRLKKGKPRNRFRKGKLRPVGLNHFNTGVQQALHVSSGGGEFSGRAITTTQNPFPNLSPGYSRVTQNLPNALPAIVYGTTTNQLDDDEDEDGPSNGNNSWIPIIGPGVRPVGGGGGRKAKKTGVNLTRILKNKARPRHRYSSNYSNRAQSLKVRSHRLAGILSQAQENNLPGGEVVAVYPHNKNYSTVTARSRAKSTSASSSSSTGTPHSEFITMTTTTTTTSPSMTSETTTTDSDIIHARITKIPNRRPVDVVLNVTTQFPLELDDKVRARLKAIMKIVRRLP